MGGRDEQRRITLLFADDASVEGDEQVNLRLSKLEQIRGDYVNAEVVEAYLDSTEYRQRFGS